MYYEWDEKKRETNLAKHGLDFLDADLVFEAEIKVTMDVSRGSDKETRFADFAEVHGRLLKLVYTMRGNKVRCISMRVASQNERRCFDETKNRQAFE